MLKKTEKPSEEPIMNKPLCCYHSSCNDFLETDVSSWIKNMSSNFILMYTENPSPSQVNAWKDSYKKILPELNKLQNKNIYLIFEYELPLEGGRRPDLVILTESKVIVIEFKEKNSYAFADIDQVSAYARDIKNYHKASHDMDVQSVLIPTQAKVFSKKHGKVLVLSPSRLSDYLISLDYHDFKEKPEEWLNSPYEPLPSLVEAARKIYRKEPLPYIRHAHSTGIPEALNKLRILTKKAEQTGERVIIFVTGVPGAGKTLLGIQFTYESFEEEKEYKSLFLSGNGPLVSVLQYALKSNVFIKPLLNFIRQYGINRRGKQASRIVVFDEAQRAWDAKRVYEKYDVKKSEPELIIEIAEGTPGWCIFMGLIGEGQEIHKGEEAGIKQWREVLKRSSEDWTVVCPPKISGLFSDIANVKIIKELDLTISLRSHLAEEVTDWTDSVLKTNISDAAIFANLIKAHGFDAYITKNLERAKEYCHRRYENSPEKKYGLLASSKAKILPIYGVDNSFMTTRKLKVGPWYYDPKDHPLSCCQFDMVATEFACQGLELDMPIICWGEDMLWKDNEWDALKRGSKGTIDPEQLRLNSYRVLLTRGRDGFIVYMPDDISLGNNYDILVESGLIVL